jgi:hypothetical protein
MATASAIRIPRRPIPILCPTVTIVDAVPTCSESSRTPLKVPPAVAPGEVTGGVGMVTGTHAVAVGVLAAVDTGFVASDGFVAKARMTAQTTPITPALAHETPTLLLARRRPRRTGPR